MPRVNAKVSSNKTLVIVAVIVGMLLLGFLAAIFIPPLIFGKPYFAVYTTNGEIFVGKASWFPRFNLTDVYIVQTGVSAPEAPPGGNLQLVPLRDAPWSPKKLYFERGQVVFYGPIDEGSDVATALENR